MIKKMIASGFALLLFCGSGLAADLGNYGQLYPIDEPDMLDFIHERLSSLEASGELKREQAKIAQKIQEHVLRPTPTVLPTATQSRTFYYTPTFTVPWDIHGANGQLIFKAGTTINALDESSVKAAAPYAHASQFNETLIFINADDAAQVQFAKNIQEKNALVKIILINGNIKDAAKTLGRVYFDQKGLLVKRFDIHAVPAVIKRVGQRLVIQEIPVSS